MTVRQLHQTDATQIAEIETACFADPWSVDSICSAMENKNNAFFGVFSQNRLIGYGGVSVVAGEGYVLNIGVLPKYRTKGAGRMLLESIIQHCQKQRAAFLSLEVRVSNAPARRLYEDGGFMPAGLRRGFYQNPKEDALILTKYFSGGDRTDEYIGD